MNGTEREVFHVKIDTGNEMTEVVVVDSRFEKVIEGIGTVEIGLPAGRYLVKTRIGEATGERFISVPEETQVTVAPPPPIEQPCSSSVTQTPGFGPRSADAEDAPSAQRTIDAATVKGSRRTTSRMLYSPTGRPYAPVRSRDTRQRARSRGPFDAVGETGFEPATARPPAGCATRLRHSP